MILAVFAAALVPVAAQDAPVRTVADAAAVVQVETGVPKPATSPAGWVTSNDYPPTALRRREQGVVAFTLEVDAAGGVTGCSVTTSSGSAVLDETTCRLLRSRASFTPARDGRGQALPGRWSSRFRWEMPPAPLPSVMEKPAALHIGFDIAPDGSVANCVVDAQGRLEEPPPLCPELENIPASVLDYLRGGATVPVSLSADMTFGPDGVAPPPIQGPKAGVVTFAHMNFVAEPNPAGRARCRVEGAWGDFKAQVELPCPRGAEAALGALTKPYRSMLTVGSSGPAPDPEELGPLIALLIAKAEPDDSEKVQPSDTP
jgi:TonB family protein